MADGSAPATILADLRDRLVRQRTGTAGAWTYTLDATVLPSTGDGNPGTVRTALTAALVPGAPLAIVATGDPALGSPGGPLTLAGTSAALTADPRTAVNLVFSVDTAGSLQAVWTATPPAGWTLSQAFGSLADTVLDELPVSGAKFAAATAPGHDPAWFFPLAAGLQYQATLAVRADLTPASGAPAEPGAQYTRIGGSVAITAGGRPRFSWPAESTLGPLTIAPTGQPPLSLTGGRPIVTCAPDADGPGVTVSAAIAGSVALGGTAFTGRLDLPTVASDTLTFTASASHSAPVTVAGTRAALTDAGILDVLGGELPADLLALAGASVTGYAVTFSAAPDEPSTTTLTLGLGTWTMLESPNLSVSGLALTATVTRAADFLARPVASWSVTVTGRLNNKYTVTATVGDDGLWYLDVDATSASSLADMAALTGHSATDMLAVLPTSLANGGVVPVRSAGVVVDVAAGALLGVAVTIGQTSDWPLLGGAVRLSGWQAELSVDRDTAELPWTVSGTITGNITLTGGGSSSTFAVEVPLAAGGGHVWTLRLAPGSTVELPTVGEVLSLLGAPPQLPEHVASWGGFTLTEFILAVNPDTTKLEYLAFDGEQTGDWIVIAPDGLIVSNISAEMVLAPTVSGWIGGTITINDTRVGVRVTRDKVGGPWQLLAAYDDPVAVLNFAALGSWFDGDGAKALLAGIPMAKGFLVRDLIVDFAQDATGAPTLIDVTISIADEWPVIPGHVALTYLRANLRTPYPITANSLTGTVAATVNVAGTNVGLTAAKPGTDQPWSFSGSLLTGLTIDLIGAAGTAGAPTPALPADAVRLGLPASIEIVSANVRAVPATGEFHFDGQADLNWTIPLGTAPPIVRSVGGSVDIARTGAPVKVTLTGEFAYAGIDADVTLAIGTAATPTVLTGTVVPTKAPAIQVGALTDGIGARNAAQQWATVAAGLPALTFRSAAFYLNLTTSQFAVYGSIGWGHDLLADGLVYLSAQPDQPWTYAVALSLTGFTFGALSPALSAVDGYVHVTEAHLVVCDLAGIPLKDLAETTTTLLNGIGSTVRPLAGLTGQAQQLSTGAYFTAQIDFGTGPVLPHIRALDSSPNTATVWLSALIDTVHPADTVFTAGLSDIHIANTVTLTHTAANQAILLRYQPAAQNRVDLVGRVELTGIFGTTIGFDTTLTSTDTNLTTKVTSTGPDIALTWLPLVALSQPKLVMTYTWAVPAGNGHAAQPQTSTVMLTGTALLGRAPADGHTDTRTRLDGQLVLVSGAPALVAINVAADLSVAALMTAIFTGQAATWSFIDITLQSGTQLYYYDPAADPSGSLKLANGKARVAGFNIEALLRLTLIRPIVDLRATLTVTQDPKTHQYTQVSGAVSLRDPVNLGFAQLAGPDSLANQPHTGGPELRFTTGTAAAFSLQTGINFLGAAFAVVSVRVAKGTDNGTVFTGTLTASQTPPPFDKLTCTFTYTTHPSRASEFAIKDWPAFTFAKELGNLIDFVQAIKDLMQTSDKSFCGAMSDFVASAYTTSFTVRPTVTLSGNDLAFALTGQYTITAAGSKDPFLTVDLPPFTVPIPATTKWADLPAALANGVKGGASIFATDLLRQTDKIALFLAVLVGEKAVSVAAELACNWLVDAATAQATEAALLAITEGLGIAGAVAAIATAIKKAAGSGGTGTKGQLGTPHMRYASYKTGTVSGTWDTAPGANGYYFELLLGARSVVHKTLGNVIEGELAVDLTPLPSGEYEAHVRALRGNDTSGWSSSYPLVKYAGPPVTLGYTATFLTARWTDSDATTYTVQFFDPSGAQIGPDQDVAKGVGHAEVAVSDPVADFYTARVRAQNPDQFPGAFGATARLKILSLAAPPPPAIGRAGAALTATWAVTRGYSYDLVLTDGTNTLATSTATGSPATLTPNPALVRGQTYQLKMRARATDALGPWTTTPFAAWDVPVPQPASVDIFDIAGTLTVQWTPVTLVAGAPAVTYRLELFDQANPQQVIGVQPAAPRSPSPISRTDGNPLDVGATYVVKVRAEVAGNPGPWASSLPLRAIGTLAAPSSVVLGAVGSVLTASWVAPPDPPGLHGSLHFGARLFALVSGKATLVGEVDDLSAPSWTAVRSDHATPAARQDYHVEVWAWAERHIGVVTSSATVRILGRPVLANAQYGGGTILAQWWPDPDASLYELQATSTMGDKVTTAVTASPGFVPLQGHVAGVPYSVTVTSTRAGSVSDPSAAATVPVNDQATSLYVSGDSTGLTLRWAPVPGANPYGVVIRQAVTRSQVQATYKVGPSVTFTSLADMTPNTLYTAEVWPMFGGIQGKVTASAAFVIPAAPTGLTAAFDGHNLTVGWTASAGTVGGYLVTVTGPNGDLATVKNASGSADPTGRHQVRIPVSALNLGSGAYTVTVEAQLGSITSVRVTTTIDLTETPTLGTPSSVVLGAVGSVMTASWVAPPDPPGLEGSLRFGARLIAVVSGVASQVGEDADLPSPSWTAVRSDQRAPVAGEDYYVEVWAWAPHHTSVMAGSATVRILGRPVLLEAKYGAGMISAQWWPDADASLYELRAVATTGDTVLVASPSSPGFVPLPGHVGGVPYSVTVTSTRAGSVSDPSTSAGVPVTDQATSLYVSGDSTALKLQWAPVPSATTYTVEILLVATGWAAQSASVTVPSKEFTSLADMTPMTAYLAQVTPMFRGIQGKVAASAAILIPAAPTEPTAAFDGQNLTVGWTASAGTVTGYLVTVRGSNGSTATTKAAPGTADATGHHQVQIPASALNLGSGTYAVTVEAQLAAIASAPATTTVAVSR